MIVLVRKYPARAAWHGVGHGVFMPAEWRSLAQRSACAPRVRPSSAPCSIGASEKVRGQLASRAYGATLLWRILRKLHVQVVKNCWCRSSPSFILPKRTNQLGKR